MSFLYRERIYGSYKTWKESESPKYSGFKKQLGEKIPKLIYPEIKFFSHLQKNDAILELGCGNGDFLRVLKREGFINLQGVDFEVDQVEEGISFCSSDIFRFLKNNLNKYQAIYLFDVLEHFSKDEVIELLTLIKGAMAPGGTLLVRVPNVTSLTGLYNQFSDFSHETFFTECSLRQVFMTMGFNSIEVFGVEIWIKTILDPRRWPGLLFFGLRAFYLQAIAKAFGGPTILSSNLIAQGRL
jgi:predicted SAM-dependent methyltransferase